MGDEFYFDEAAADRVCRFFETQLRHFEGKHANTPFTLLPWERKVLRDVFGWKRPDGTRRYRTAYIEIPRKQGKSLFAAGIGIYLLVADGEAGAQVYSAAANTAQAGITFGAAKKMIAASPALRRRIKERRWHLEHPKSQSIYKVLSGDAIGKHGLSVSGLIFDELHEQSNRDLWEALTTSMGARRQPLTVAITTAGHGGDQTICHELHDKAVAYLTGEIKPGDEKYDDTFYAAIYAADPLDDWTDPKVWAKANPSLGHTVPLEFLERECVKAKENPAAENAFRRLYLCQWTEQATRWLSLDTYDKNTRPLNYEDYKGQPCYVALDLSQSYDLTAVVMLFPEPDGKWVVIPRIYCPRDTAERRTRDDQIPYTSWIRDGHVIGTTGSTIHYPTIKADVLQIAAECPVIEVAYDKFNATLIVNELEAAGLTTVVVEQNYLGLSAACKEFERRLTTGEIVIAENPAMRQAAASVEIEQDRHGNIRPVKPMAKGKYAGTMKFKIDPLVATLTAISRAMLRPATDASAQWTGAIEFV